MPDSKDASKAPPSNVITIHLPASCPLFRYTLNQKFGGTQSMPPGFQVPSVAPQTGQGAIGSSGAGGGTGQVSSGNPDASGAGGKGQGPVFPPDQAAQGGGATAPAVGGQTGSDPAAAPIAPQAGGDLPTHTQGQPPPPTDAPASAPAKRQNPDSPIPVVREGEQPPPGVGGQAGQPATSDQGAASEQGAQGVQAGQSQLQVQASPADPGQTSNPPSTAIPLTDAPSIPTGAETGWLGITQQSGNSTTAKQLQGQLGQIQVLPFPITGFTPLYTESPYQLTLSGLKQTQYPWPSGTVYNQPFGPGWLTMDVTCPTTCGDQSFAFIGADVTTEACPPGVQLQSVSADDADKVITYAGFAPFEKNNKVVEIRGDYKNTLSMTARANATASFKFRGTAVMVKGVTAPKLGDYCVTVDGTSTYLTSKDDVETHAVPLYFMTSLDDRQVHEVVVTSLTGTGGDIGLALDQVNLWGPAGQTGFIGPDGGLLVPGDDTAVGGMPVADEAVGGGSKVGAGAIVGAVLGTLLAILLMWWLLRRYSKVAEAKKEEKKMNPWDEANLLSNQKNEAVYVTTVAEQRYVYPGLIAHSELK